MAYGKTDLIEKIEQFKYASSQLSHVWEVVGEGLGSVDYPFQADFADMNGRISDWCHAFIEEINTEKALERFTNPVELRYWIDLREHSETCWIFKQLDSGLVLNELCLGVRENGTEGLTEITADIYHAVAEIWNSTEYDQDPARDRFKDILEIVTTPAVPALVTCQAEECEGGYVNGEKCTVCWGTGLVSEGEEGSAPAERTEAGN